MSSDVPELIVTVVMLDNRLLECLVHPLHLTVGPGMVRLGQVMVYTVILTMVFGLILQRSVSALRFA